MSLLLSQARDNSRQTQRKASKDSLEAWDNAAVAARAAEQGRLDGDGSLSHQSIEAGAGKEGHAQDNRSSEDPPFGGTRSPTAVGGI